MDAREHAAVAPLLVGVAAEAAAQHLALRFEAQQRRLDRAASSAERSASLARPSAGRSTRASRARISVTASSASGSGVGATRRPVQPSLRIRKRAIEPLGARPKARAAGCSVVARRCATSSSNQACHAGTGGSTISVESASCSSSASRTTGHDSSATSRDRRRIEHARRRRRRRASCGAAARRARGALRAARRRDTRTDWR